MKKPDVLTMLLKDFLPGFDHGKTVLITGGHGSGKKTLAAQMVREASRLHATWHPKGGHIDAIGYLKNMKVGNVVPFSAVSDMPVPMYRERIVAVKRASDPIDLTFESVHHQGVLSGADYRPGLHPQTAVFDGFVFSPEQIEMMNTQTRYGNTSIVTASSERPHPHADLFDTSVVISVDYHTHRRTLSVMSNKLGKSGVSSRYDLIEGRGFELVGGT